MFRKRQRPFFSSHQTLECLANLETQYLGNNASWREMYAVGEWFCLFQSSNYWNYVNNCLDHQLCELFCKHDIDSLFDLDSNTWQIINACDSDRLFLFGGFLPAVAHFYTAIEKLPLQSYEQQYGDIDLYLFASERQLLQWKTYFLSGSQFPLFTPGDPNIDDDLFDGRRISWACSTRVDYTPYHPGMCWTLCLYNHHGSKLNLRAIACTTDPADTKDLAYSTDLIYTSDTRDAVISKFFNNTDFNLLKAYWEIPVKWRKWQSQFYITPHIAKCLFQFEST